MHKKIVNSGIVFVFLCVGAIFYFKNNDWKAKKSQQTQMMPMTAYTETAPRVIPGSKIYDIHHSDMHYRKDWYCGHPRQGIYGCFDGVEIVVGHHHAPCAYEKFSDVMHDFGGYHSRAVMLLQRSTDGCKTWPVENEVIVYDETISDKEKKSFLYQTGAARENYNMFDPNSLFFFGETFLLERNEDNPICFALRSIDRGKTWEKVPTLIEYPDKRYRTHIDNYPVVRMPDGKTLLTTMSVKPLDKYLGNTSLNLQGKLVFYSSVDNGLHWKIESSIGDELKKSGIGGRFTYPGLLLLPSGELQAYCVHKSNSINDVDGIQNAICQFISNDGGKTWGDSKPIVGKSSSKFWKNSLKDTSGSIYSSPWPIMLKDGRIVVLFGRRRMPMGIGCIISSDSGKTWSEEFILRDDGIFKDLGYPVGSELKDGRIFCAYYYTKQDGKLPGNNFRGTRYIAATTFRIY